MVDNLISKLCYMLMNANAGLFLVISFFVIFFYIGTNLRPLIVFFLGLSSVHCFGMFHCNVGETTKKPHRATLQSSLLSIDSTDICYG